MTDEFATPDLSLAYCPGCQPDRDPTREILRAYWCTAHDPALRGLDDPVLSWPGMGLPSGTEESESETNRRMADLLRGAR